MKLKVIDIIPLRLYLIARWYDFKLKRNLYFAELQRKRSRVTDQFSSYKPFDDTKTIFIHIPKCAGVSINQALYGNLAGGHTTLDQYINIFPPSRFQSYYKFTFVRNPWDRLVSSYIFLKNGGLNSNDSEFFNKELAQFLDFDDFVRGWLTKENIMKYHHFMPQYKFITDRYFKCSVDYIGYFENIEEDYNFIKTKVGVGRNLPKINSVKRSRYEDFYSEDTKKIVADVYKPDIEIFDYRFEGPRSFVRNIHPSKVKSYKI